MSNPLPEFILQSVFSQWEPSDQDAAAAAKAVPQDMVLLLLLCHPQVPITSPAAALLPPALGQAPAQTGF